MGEKASGRQGKPRALPRSARQRSMRTRWTMSCVLPYPALPYPASQRSMRRSSTAQRANPNAHRAVPCRGRRAGATGSESPPARGASRARRPAAPRATRRRRCGGWRRRARACRWDRSLLRGRGLWLLSFQMQEVWAPAWPRPGGGGAMAASSAHAPVDVHNPGLV